jgi:hypothetical protein
LELRKLGGNLLAGARPGAESAAMLSLVIASLGPVTGSRPGVGSGNCGA